ncbi:MAG: methyl-accepting chemotaxis protein [Bacteriovorax sp.]|nr:methyl-accepting chemotaxis protein [Bacteriovorax sp.]
MATAKSTSAKSTKITKSTKSTKTTQVDNSMHMIESLKKTYAYIEFDPSGTILDLNNLFAQVMGYTRDDLIGKHHRIFVSPSEVASAEYKKLWNDLASGIPRVAELTRVTKSGASVYLGASYNPVTNDKGDVVSVFKIAQDITDKKTQSDIGLQRKSMSDKSPINILFATPDGVMTYMNEASLKTLKTLEQYLPDKAANLAGKSIDWFHKNPAHQKRIISDPKNLPYRSTINVGPEKLDLLVTGIFDDAGTYIGPMVTWEIITAKLDLMTKSQRATNMVDKSPINTMLATPDGLMIYMNEASLKTLKTLEQYLPEKAANLVGKSIDWFHKNPAHQRKIIGDPKNLPYRSIIGVGPEKLDLLVTGIFDESGTYIGPMVTWEIVTVKLELIADLTKSSEDLASSATNVLAISSSLSAAAEETSAQANTASVASEEVNAGVQTVASNMEEMVTSIKDITKTTNEASNMSNEAMKLAKNANQIINQLGESSMDIGNVIKVISSIAQQTNLLALNATIEAARAGEAGKGFAVVANEVKELAKQTAKATNDITKKIETIQADSKNAVGAIAEISSAIEKVNGYAGNIAASVEEQAATTNEVKRIVSESAEGVKQINENISQVSQAAASTGKDASNSQAAAKVVGEIAEALKKYVARLKL